ncbi:MAG TPA: phosphoribosylanthranilate isomerase [Blastocatellia bacterium]|nr:phosphoribosylanthranilate isomerase [Blastocatellia bacterium]
MEATAVPRVKVCCISSAEEARAAIRRGASALGLVSEMPSGPGVISEELIAEIAAATPPAVSTFLLTSRQDARAIVEQHRRCRTSTIQICDRLERGSYEELRAALPGIKLVQVVHVTGEESVEEALGAASRADAILLDSGNQLLEVKELGGTGRVHDWALSRKIREEVGVPVFLAGGLNPGNIAEAIRQVGPFGVDLCSGVRADGRLDEVKLSAFFGRMMSQAQS